MDKDRLRYLLTKHIENTISSIEIDELSALLQEMDVQVQEEALTEALHDYSPEYPLGENRKQILYDKIHKAVLKTESGSELPFLPTKKLFPFRKYAAIAAIILFGFFTLLWLWDRPERDLDNLEGVDRLAENVSDDIYLANDSVPFVRLPNGAIQLLDGNISASLVGAGVDISKGENGETIYQVQRHVDPSSLEEWRNMVFSTPKGQSSKVILHDGTQVWLNSGSSLEYPVAFSVTERRVKLVGEAYFDVEHMRDKPFYVETDKGPLIQVLGTSFNVSAYKEDQSATTTLIEGSVQLIGKNNQTVLRPNEQVIAGMHDHVLKKERVNVADFISWKDGYFSFNGQSIPEILATVQRWYDIEEIDYTYLPKEKFTGTFKRTKSLKSLLVKLEKISNVKFQIKERRIVVMN